MSGSTFLLLIFIKYEQKIPCASDGPLNGNLYSDYFNRDFNI